MKGFLTENAVAPGQTIVQVPDTDAVMKSVNELRREVAEHSALHKHLGRYTQPVISIRAHFDLFVRGAGTP